METFGQPFWQSGDTIYANLCSVPCTITTYDPSGDCVILCQLPGFTGVDRISDGGSPLSLTPDPVIIGEPLTVVFSEDGTVDLTLTDAQGRVLVQARCATGKATIGTGQLHAGPHLVRVRWPDGRTRTQRLLVL